MLPLDHFLPAGEVLDFDRVALASHLRRHGLAFDPAAPVRQFAGGFANRNYLVEISGRPAVLRRPPAGELPRGAHDMGREHRLLAALSPVLPFVPAGLHFTADASVLGAPFQLIEYRPGLVIRGSAPVAELGAEAGPRLSATLVETLAQIHLTEPERCGLADLGRPEGFVGRAITGWTRRGLDVATPGARSLVEAVSSWLTAQPLRDRAPRLLHLDFKLDNVILDPATLRPRAVVDWDMGTRGDPLFDLATLLSYWVGPDDPAEIRAGAMMPTVHGAMWSRSEAAEAYGRLMGESLDDLPVLYVLALLKLGVVFLQLHRQWVTGAVRSSRYGDFGRQGEAMLEHAWDIARGRRGGP